jgi:DNA-binding IscR family transcriptional regulator
VRVTVQELAEAIGSVREVVARTLRQLRMDGVIRTGPGGIVVLDLAELRREAISLS